MGAIGFIRGSSRRNARIAKITFLAAYWRRRAPHLVKTMDTGIFIRLIFYAAVQKMGRF
jgi:hypothetical protein